MPSFRGTVSDSIFEDASCKLANKTIQIGIFIFQKMLVNMYVNFLSITMSSRALRKVQRFIAAAMSPLIAHSLIITASLLTDILIIFFCLIYFLCSQCFPSGLLSLTDGRAGVRGRTRDLTPARVTQSPVSHLPSLSASRWVKLENVKCDGTEHNWIARKEETNINIE